MKLPVTICHLYPTMMNLYGDRGNILTLEQRFRWHGFEPQVVPVCLGEKVDFRNFDVICIGGGQDREQKAMLSLREILHKQGLVKAFWQV